jgi:hypothetical protein
VASNTYTAAHKGSKQTMFLAQIKDVKDKVNLLEIELLKGSYTWDNIKDYLEAKNTITVIERKGYGRRRIPNTLPSALDMTAHIIDYLKDRPNMTASKTEIFNGIKNLYPTDVLAIPHRSKGKDTSISALEYRLDWACSILTVNKKAVGRNQDPKIPSKHIKLINKSKFTKEEMIYLKKNRCSLAGFNTNH